MNLSSNILSDITVFMKYAMFREDKSRRETFEEIVDRNKAMHIKRFPKLKDQIEEAYTFVYDKKVLPSMRSLQFAGRPIEVNPARIYNCSFLPISDPEAFSEVMFLLLAGTGVGYSVQRHHVDKLPEIRRATRTKRWLVADSIEGWADAVKALISSYMENKFYPIFDFSDIRPKGARLVTSGGKAPGPQPLKDCLHNIQKILDRKENGEKLTSLEAHDICCYIADAVLAGGIRRSACIALFDLDDNDMLTCKFGDWYVLNPQRGRSNNSAVIVRHKIDKETFINLWKKVELSNSGEPGIFFTNDKDAGLNPCAEISLRPFQFCNLVTINASVVETQEQLDEYSRAAAFIATLQASYTDFHYLREEWKVTTEKEALIGVSMTGIASGKVMSLDLTQAAEIVKKENERVAKLLGINKAARCTTVKPEGCLTLDTVIRTADGNKTMAELISLLTDENVFEVGSGVWIEPKSDVFVYNENDDTEKITKLYVNGMSEVYEITMEDGFVAKLTSEHRLKTTTGWKRAKDLSEGDEINSTNIQSIKKLPPQFTVDIETQNTHTYQLGNKVVSHNTTSLVLGSSSGIHAWHANHYIRRIRVGKNESIYKHLLENHPELLEDEFFKPHLQAVISVPQKAPEGAITRKESALELLDRVSKVYNTWIKTGHRKGPNCNNVSTTVSIKPTEWDSVGEWMWEHRTEFTALSVLPHSDDDHSYVQAPFEEITAKKYNELVKTLNEIDLTRVVELSDDTDLQGEIACGGASSSKTGCEVI